ncbi:hypothetical protein E3V52_07540 [Streptococcus pseudopneumoniae]|uniref:hypothetical protein n=1 Tax=Streptococcus pseudopneumoniae TaxID=257758 RepID=UPI00110C3D98|nr:hypothetical protein [Streptococcus pseudopneumoniae]TMR77510.1 hypothetical protein E3V52_07540 [Streptococcus pseudopneumoniae]
MKAIKNRLNKLNKLAVIDEVDTVFLTQIDIGHFEVRYRIGGKNSKDIIEVYPTKEAAEEGISRIKDTKGLRIFWDNIGFCDD